MDPDSLSQVVEAAVRRALDDGWNLAFWASLASIGAFIPTIWSLILTRKALRETKEDRRAARAARSEAEALRDQYARKQRLPELLDELRALADRASAALDTFPGSTADIQSIASQALQAIDGASGYIEFERRGRINRIRDTLYYNSDIVNLKNAQVVRTCALDAVTYINHILRDDLAKAT